jgi:hypothetical protein
MTQLFSSNLQTTIHNGFTTIFENVDYVMSAKSFSNSIINILLSMTKDEFADSYTKFDDFYKSPVFVIEKTALFMPNKRPLHIIWHPYNSKIVAYIDKNKNLVMFSGRNEDSLDKCIDAMMNELKQNHELYLHELIHIYDFSRINAGFKQKSRDGRYNDVLKYINEHPVDPNLLRYFNAPSEFNARVVSAIDSAIKAKKINSFDEFKTYVLNHNQVKQTMFKNENPTTFSQDNYHRLLKWLYKIYTFYTDTITTQPS